MEGFPTNLKPTEGLDWPEDSRNMPADEYDIYLLRIYEMTKSKSREEIIDYINFIEDKYIEVTNKNSDKQKFVDEILKLREIKSDKLFK